MLGVKFKPLGIVKLTGINMEEMVNGIIVAEDIWGAELESLWDQMQSADSIDNSVKVLEYFLLKRYMHIDLHYRVDDVRNALSIIDHSNGTISVKELQNLTNTSRKTLERAFINYLGLTPKSYSQIVRFNTAKRIIDYHGSIDSEDWGYQLGYYDGSHFAADFKRFSGLTPQEYINKKYKESFLVSFCPFFPKRHLMPKTKIVLEV